MRHCAQQHQGLHAAWGFKGFEAFMRAHHACPDGSFSSLFPQVRHTFASAAAQRSSRLLPLTPYSDGTPVLPCHVPCCAALLRLVLQDGHTFKGHATESGTGLYAKALAATVGANHFNRVTWGQETSSQEPDVRPKREQGT